MAENIVKNEVLNHDGATNVTNWISQINANGTVYDIATHHGITFKDGKGDKTGTTWTGLSDLEIVIPNITDIVQTPIEFAGTVGAGGVISWNTGHGETPEIGNLVFVTSDCTFAEQACEAGDMAIYDGTNWKIVSGENQVKIVGSTDSNITDGNRTVVAVGAAKDVLVVEGKALSLTLDYADLNDKHLKTTGGKVTEVNFGTMTVGSVGVKLNKADDVATTIGELKDFQKATALKDGKVTLQNATGLASNLNLGTFTQGTQTTSQKNSALDLVVTGGDLTLASKQASGEFVDSVKINAVSFADATLGETGSIHIVTDIVSGKGQSFVNGIHKTKTEEGETADLTIEGYMKAKDGVQFVEKLEGDLSPVTSISEGSIELITSGTDFVTGFSTESSTSGDVVSSVSVTANNNTSVLNTAKVENHVLSFGSTNVTSGVTTTLGYKSLTKGAYKYTAPVATTTSFVTSGFEKVADVKYTFGKAQETTYTPSAVDKKLNTPDLTVTYGTYGFDDDGMKAVVPAQTFVASVTPGNLPTWTGYSFDTVDVTGTVGTELTTEKFEFNALKSNSINMPGVYSLSTVAEGGDITVGKEGALAAKNATVDLSTYLTGVAIVEQK